MEWLTLAVWIIIAAQGMALGLGVVIGHGLLGVQAMAAVGGLVAMIIYLATGEPSALAWVAFGLAVMGTLTMVPAVEALIAAPPEPLPAASQTAAEVYALLAGVQLPLFMVVSVLSLLTALGQLTTGT